MKDTAPEVDQRFRAMLLQRSEAERLKMGCSMPAMALALVRASVLEKDPLALSAGPRRPHFFRHHGHDFDAVTREKMFIVLVAPGLRVGRELKVARHRWQAKRTVLS